MDKIIKRIIIGELLWERETGEITGEGRKTLEKWLSESPENRTLANSISGELSPKINFDRAEAEKAWNRFSMKARQQRKLSLRRMIIRYSAVAALLAVTLGIYFYMGNPAQHSIVAEFPVTPAKTRPVLVLEDGSQIELSAALPANAGIEMTGSDEELSFTVLGGDDTAPRINTVIVPLYSDCRINLPDGTTVSINSGSRFSYPTRFTGDRREVWLDGEAFFEVEQDDEMPFIVHFEAGDVRVLGTKFNVESYADRDQARVTLTQGAVLCKTQTSECTLAPGSQAVITQGHRDIEVVQADVRVTTAWLRDQFYFKNRRLGDIMEELSVWYGVEVSYEDEGLKDVRFTVETGRFEDLSNILDLLAETRKISYRKTGTGILLSPRK